MVFIMVTGQRPHIAPGHPSCRLLHHTSVTIFSRSPFSFWEEALWA